MDVKIVLRNMFCYLKDSLASLVLSFFIFTGLFAQDTVQVEKRESNVLDGTYVEFYIATNKRNEYFNNSLFISDMAYSQVREFSKVFDYNKYIPKRRGKRLSIKKNSVLYNPSAVFVTQKNAQTHFLLNEKGHFVDTNNYVLPSSIRYYIDSSMVENTKEHIPLVFKGGAEVLDSLYLKPFYFSKQEVTNSEYREFVNWVLDSNLRRELSFEDDYGGWVIKPDSCNIEGEEDYWGSPTYEMWKLNYDKEVNYESKVVKDILSVNGILTSSIAYLYYIPSSYFDYTYFKGSLVFGGCVTFGAGLKCYWRSDLKGKFDTELNYFTNPDYSNYPVVGISYNQALSFLDWKQKQLQKEIDELGLDYNIILSLPTAAQWELVALTTFDKSNNLRFKSNYNEYLDQSWVTDLSVSNLDMIETEDSVVFHKHYYRSRENLLRKETGNKSESKHTYSCSVNKKGKSFTFKNKEKHNEVLGLDGNVSEWLSESFETNWSPIFNLRQKQLALFDAEDVSILATMEAYFNNGNDKDGKLIQGANWLDDRKDNSSYLKVFKNPNKSFYTVGFRYVTTFEPK